MHYPSDQQTGSHGPNLIYCLFLQIKFCWNTPSTPIYVSSVANFVLQKQCWVIETQTTWPTGSKIFTVCPFAKKVYHLPHSMPLYIFISYTTLFLWVWNTFFHDYDMLYGKRILWVKLWSLISWHWVSKKGDCLGWAWPNQVRPWQRQDPAADALWLTWKKAKAIL